MFFVTNILYHTQKFSEWLSVTVIVSNFHSKMTFTKSQKNSEKNSNVLRYTNKFIWYKNEIFLSVYLSDNNFTDQFFDDFSALLLCRINVLNIFNTINFFLDFCCIAQTKILIDSNFWLKM